MVRLVRALRLLPGVPAPRVRQGRPADKLRQLAILFWGRRQDATGDNRPLDFLKRFPTPFITLLVATLLDAQLYPATELAMLYQQRWEIETNLKHLKQTLRMDVLRTKTVDGIHKELAVFAIVYNLIRLLMLQAAMNQKVPVSRISFIDAQRRLRHAVAGSPSRKLVVVPERPHRFEPRVRKRRPKEFDLVRKPRRQLKQALIRQQLKTSVSAIRDGSIY